MNIFRQTKDKSLDKKFLRVCAVHKLVDRKLISKQRAIELLQQRDIYKARQTVEMWLANPKQSWSA